MGSITRTFANQIKTGGKLDADGLDLTDTFAFTGTVTGAGGTNTPNFEVSKTDSNQTLSTATATLVTFNNEVFDSDSAFASNKFTVPAGKGGKYYFYASIKWGQDDRGIRVVYLYKNGSIVKEILDTASPNQPTGESHSTGAILNLSASDYVEIYCYQTTADPETITASSTGTYFGGYKLIE
jgi:hypothetical protein